MSAFGYILWSFVVGGSIILPLWFIPMMLIFYLLAPLFERIGNSRLLLYFAALTTCVLSLFSFRPIGNSNPILSFIHFLGFYLLGIVFARESKFADSIVKSKIAWTIIISGILIVVSADYFSQHSKNSIIGFTDGLGVINFAQLGKFGLIVAMYPIFEKFVNQKSSALEYIAKISFGLFFLHGFYMLIYSVFFKYINTSNLLGNVVTEFFVVVCLSFLTVHVIKVLLKGNSRYVIGC
jgi:hypothetical protein